MGDLVKNLDDLGMRNNTLIFFAGDNGTYKGVVTTMKDGRQVRGGKATMEDTGSWVPLLASWPGMLPRGTTYEGLVDFTDIMPTCLQLAGTKAPKELDGRSFAPQLQGKAGTPRDWVYVHWVKDYFVRDAKWRFHANGDLFDISGSPYAQTLVQPKNDTPESKAARERLRAVARKLHE